MPRKESGNWTRISVCSLDFQLGARHRTFSFSLDELSAGFSQFSAAAETCKLSLSAILIGSREKKNTKGVILFLGFNPDGRSTVSALSTARKSQLNWIGDQSDNRVEMIC